LAAAVRGPASVPDPAEAQTGERPAVAGESLPAAEEDRAAPAG
jgi:hypothetical protein